MLVIRCNRQQKNQEGERTKRKDKRREMGKLAPKDKAIQAVQRSRPRGQRGQTEEIAAWRGDNASKRSDREESAKRRNG